MVQADVTASGSHEVELTGRIGLPAVVFLVVVLGIHPFGSTGLYDDGEAFLDHVDGFWIVLHFLGAIGLLLFPFIIDVWGKHLSTQAARLAGRVAGIVAIIGMGVGMFHLIASDTMTFVAFRDTYAASAGTEAGEVGIDLLLRFHAASLSAWVTSFWLATPLALGFAAFLDRRLPRWMAGLAWASAGLQVAALSITVVEGQWTTVSEQVVFRLGATLFLVWMLVAAWWMRRGAVHPQATSIAA